MKQNSHRVFDKKNQNKNNKKNILKNESVCRDLYQMALATKLNITSTL